MQTTMNLLDAALKANPAPYWHEKLKLNRNALHNAKMRGHISPAIAYAIAQELGGDAQAWALIAAAESERNSPCKERMIKQLAKDYKALVMYFKNYVERRQRPRNSAL